ncbi:MAG: hypothetical protein LBO66_12215 [Deltaproteobacteria bacterium]|jgi:hypothetical protein|nr:hypothetical protein [Deltaproteobacteria bacterium]
MRERNKFNNPSPPDDEILPQIDAERVIIGSREHINQVPDKRELTTLFDTIKNQNFQIERLATTFNNVNIKAMRISGLESDKRYLTFACLGCVFFTSMAGITDGDISKWFNVGSAIWAIFMTIPAFLIKNKEK